MRLIDGSSKAEGRVEVFYDGSWGTICDNGWDLRDARVVCRMLGFKGALDAPTSARFGQGSEDILLDLVGCDGTEGNLAESYPNSVGVRLVGGSNSSEGRVEIMYNGTWGTVCGDGWDLKDAKVVCRMLGFGDASAAPGSAKFGEGSDEILLSLVGCDGTENNLAECAHLGFGVHNCHHGEDAGVTCLLGVRLVGGANKYEGTVEILHEGSWGTVCDDLWDIDDAKVVCRQLGFDGALAALPTARFGQGSGEVLLEGVQCNGTEASLIDCNHKGIREHNCGHKEDAGVSCMRVAREDITGSYDPVTSDVTKLPTSYRMSATDVLMPAADATTARVVCRMLGFDGALDAQRSARFGPGSGDILYIDCFGSEDSLSDCLAWVDSSCEHHMDVGAVCYSGAHPEPFKVRLVGGSNDAEGTVEVLYDESWGTICHDGWDLRDARWFVECWGLVEPWTHRDLLGLVRALAAFF
ncbi:deleted in malignant brain tumors 1 protein-like [Strongylocentrotus purpuratus]|uniref:SRCR domain-containing protein n=1 Tax=Strongylocentrotus purpuratus TaxID=7668 RepID=A0A7M7NBJ0_STRPU|nr:deleted in malignant brain tumors 1 protein-like [Strongylocentrotus purpuratus]